MTTPGLRSPQPDALINMAQGGTGSHSDSGEHGSATSKIPLLYSDRSFWGLAVTQFLGVLNESIFKQLILLLATPTVLELASGKSRDLQSEAQFVFAAAILIFSGVAGFVSDRVSKQTVIIGSKAVEIGLMLFGTLALWNYGHTGIPGLLFVLFILGIESAFFGPAKYGILPEMLRPADLPRANGIFLLLAFVAIFTGLALAGTLLKVFSSHVWMASLVCVVIAAVGTITSLFVRRVPVAEPGLRLRFSSLTVSREILALLRNDRALLWAILVVAVYWMVAGIFLQTLNALGKSQLGLDDLRTSILASSVGVGVAIGCVLGGYLSRDRVSRTVATTGATGLVTTLVLMSLPGGSHSHLLGFAGSVPVLVVMGIFSGMFMVAVQVALQSRPPREEKGRTIALMNQCSLIGVILGALLYKACIYTLDETGGPRSGIFAVTAALMLPVALLYRPSDERLTERVVVTQVTE